MLNLLTVSGILHWKYGVNILLICHLKKLHAYTLKIVIIFSDVMSILMVRL